MSFREDGVGQAEVERRIKKPGTDVKSHDDLDRVGVTSLDRANQPWVQRYAMDERRIKNSRILGLLRKIMNIQIGWSKTKMKHIVQ
ncbi:hypothetical protein B9Z55_025225 [Caenorhabditis nigoni]|uniref:Uncharacterized protein n=1 Tax=Caenorhabditis nigoni TaxID=1611254 RepID=A0A2G5SXT1_9PELO|nr:hypothetical protein B9Z55_025225 [Caenorhabditis nigoni]